MRALWIILLCGLAGVSSVRAADYPNPLIPQRADPHIVRHADGWYYFMGTVPEYDRIVLRRARTIAGLADAEEKVIWRKHASGPMGAHIWAPELHFLDGKWYVYFAAGAADQVWAIRLYVLENASANPLEGEWIERGQLDTGWESFALDASVFENRGRRYLIWAQKDEAIKGNTNLYIAPLASPTKLGGPAVCIARPELPWEQVRYWVNEGPVALVRNGRVFLTYSAAGTGPEYCIGLLTADAGADLLDPRSWTKSPQPVFTTDEAAGIYGPGHHSFTVAEDGVTDLLVYHARNFRDIPGDPLRDPNRNTRVQPIAWRADGTPDFGRPQPENRTVPRLPSLSRVRDFAVTAFGAIGDGVTLNTAAIQAAIDDAAAAGGGRVVIPAGTFRSGSLFLKPGVELHVARDGVLLGSDRLDDYPKRRTRIEGHFPEWRLALVNAEGVAGVRLTGEGVIDGNGRVFWEAFWQRRKENPICTNLEVERPRLVHFSDCKDVRIEGLTLRNSGFWNIHLYRCRDVLVRGVGLYAPGVGAPVRAPSSDGLDLDSCQRVTVRDCTFSVDDDCIALKGSKGPLADRDETSPPVEDILVEDCRFLNGHGVVTCGSEATVVRNVTVRRCTVSGRNNLVRLKLRPDTPQRYENLLFEDITLDGDGRIFDVAPWTQFFDLQGQPQPARAVAGVTLRRVTGRYGTLGRLQGNPGDRLENFRMEDVTLRVADEKFPRDPAAGLVAVRTEVNGRTFAP